MQHEDHGDHLDKHVDDAGYLSADGHVEENTEDMQGQQRDDHGLDQLDDDLFEISEGTMQGLSLNVREPQSDNKREDQSGHHTH